MGRVNQAANPMRKGDTVEIINTYYDSTVVGDHIYSVRLLESSNEELAKYDINGVRLIACYKVDVLYLN
jgi:hypothetical protein